MECNKYDIIGDIHGHGTELVRLLEKLDYVTKNGIYCHPEGRTVIFLGDYIDRGPEVELVLEIVFNMVSSGNALAVMGNHEYNAICYHTSDDNGINLREHNDKNKSQHKTTLQYFSISPEVKNKYIKWFMTLPLFLELDHFRIIHACWDYYSILEAKKMLDEVTLKNATGYCMNDDFLFASASPKESSIFNEKAYKIVEVLLKGKEIQLPDGCFFQDKDGHRRSEIRIKWWKESCNKINSIYEDLYLGPHVKGLNGLNVNVEDEFKKKLAKNSYHFDDVPVFFGHYWMEGTPGIFEKNIACLDWSVAKSGKLVAYRWDNKGDIDSSRLEHISS